MKIFTPENSGWDTKVNFVDENNVFLGYDMCQCCCEHFGWFISDKPECGIIEGEPKDQDLTNFKFDPDFFRELSSGSYEEGGTAIFRITDGTTDKYIHLYNVHNGYYGHGFSFSIGTKLIKAGTL